MVFLQLKLAEIIVSLYSLNLLLSLSSQPINLLRKENFSFLTALDKLARDYLVHAQKS